MKFLLVLVWLGLLFYFASYLLRWLRNSTQSFSGKGDKRGLLRALQKKYSWYRATSEGFAGILDGVPFEVSLRPESGEGNHSVWFYVHTGKNLALILSKRASTQEGACPSDWVEMKPEEMTIPSEYSVIAQDKKQAQEFLSAPGMERKLARVMQLGFTGLVHVKGGVFVSREVPGVETLPSELELRAVVSALADLPHQMPRPAMNYGF